MDTRHTTTDGDGGTDGYGNRLYVYQKLANGEPSSYTWTFSGVSAPRKIDAAGGIVSFSGVDTNNPIVDDDGQPNGSSLTQTAPSISTGTVDNTMLLASLGIRSSGTFVRPSTDLTEQVNRTSRPTTNDTGLTLAMYSAAFAEAGATGTKQATLDGASTAADTGVGHLLALRPASSRPNHFRIRHSSGMGVTCTPSTLTIEACVNTGTTTPCTPFKGGVRGTLSASGTPTVNWDSSTGGATGAGFFIPPGSSSVTKNVQITTVGSVVFGLASSTPTSSSAATCNFGSPSCTFTTADAGFVLSVPDHVAETSRTLTIRAVRKSDNSLACVPGMTGTKTVNLKCSYVNPSTGTLPVRIAGSALASSTTSACSSTGVNVSLSFDSTGVATPALQYADVGRMRIAATYTGTSGTEQGLSMVGNTQFVAAPASFAFSNITAGPIKAGAAFGATVTARNNASVVTPNFGKESTPEGVTLRSNLIFPDPSLAAGGHNPALANNLILGSAFSNGAAILSNLSWAEAGTITLTAQLTSGIDGISGNYLGSSIAAATGTSSNIGRFIPSHFDTVISGVASCPATSPTTICMPCPEGLTCPSTFNGFVYSGQPFATRVIARNTAGGTTLNYDGTRLAESGGPIAANVALSVWDAKGGTASNNPNNGTLSGMDIPVNAFTLGEASATPAYALPNAYPSTTLPPGPTDIYVRAVEQAADGVTSNTGSSSVEGGIKIVSGRFWIDNANGSELLKLPINYTVQYWNGAGWVRSRTDNLTTFGPSDVIFNNCKNNLIQPNTSPPTNCKSVVQVASSLSAITVGSGGGKFALNAPGSGNVGSASVRIGAPSYLPSNTAIATFGIYKSKFIYLREMY